MLERKAIELIEEMNEAKNEMREMFIDLIDIEDLDDEGVKNLKLMGKCLGIMTKSMEYMQDEAQVLDSMNRKLDQVILSLSIRN